MQLSKCFDMKANHKQKAFFKQLGFIDLEMTNNGIFWI